MATYDEPCDHMKVSVGFAQHPVFMDGYVLMELLYMETQYKETTNIREFGFFLKAFSKHLLINKVKKSYTYVCNKKFKDNFKMPLLFNSCKSQLDYPINMTQHDTK